MKIYRIRRETIVAFFSLLFFFLGRQSVVLTQFKPVDLVGVNTSLRCFNKTNEESRPNAGNATSLGRKRDDSMFQGIVSSGDGWSMWDRNSIAATNDVTCQWTDFRSLTGVRTKMCTYPKKDDIYVSAMIQSRGHWEDCHMLVKLWRMTNNETHHNSTLQEETDENKKNDNYFLDIGVNIGACLMEMLLSTNAKIIGFEANPANAAHVTTTLLAQPKNLRDRVAFFSIGIGTNSSTAVIHAAQDNRGHSVINSMTLKDYANQDMGSPIPIVLDRLDTILPGFENGTNTIRLIKMDVEGFECNVMDSGKGIFASAKALKTEVNLALLEGQGCSSTGLIDRIEASGFRRPPVTSSAIFELNLVKENSINF